MKNGIRSGIPVVIGYFPVAMAFGILAKTEGFSLIEVVCFSFVLFAGASQFIGLSMMTLGAGFSEIIIATCLLNFRHFFMSASLSNQMPEIQKHLKPVIGFFITDEIFSVASFATQPLTPFFLLGLEIIAYLSWGIGSITGYVLGNILPQRLQLSMGIGLYALFISILIPETKKTSKAWVLASIAGCMNVMLFKVSIIPEGWRLIIVIVISSTMGILLYDKENTDD